MSPIRTSFADPFEISFRLSVDNLLLANFEKISPILDPFAFFGEFSETFIYLFINHTVRKVNKK